MESPLITSLILQSHVDPGRGGGTLRPGGRLQLFVMVLRQAPKQLSLLGVFGQVSRSAGENGLQRNTKVSSDGQCGGF